MSRRTWLIMAVRLVRGLFFLGMAFCLFVAYAIIGGDRLPSTPEPNRAVVFLPLLGAFLCWGAAFALKRWLIRAEAEALPPGTQ